MLILILDAAVLIALYMFLTGGDSLNWGKALVTAFAISLFSFVCIQFLFDALGLFSFVPCLLVAPIMLWLICDLPLPKAAIAGAIFTVYRVVLVGAFVFSAS